MTLQTSGAISLNDLATEFGGTAPHSLSEYYAGGGLVPSGTTGTNGAVPSSGAISLWNFYGTSNDVFWKSYTNRNFNGQALKTIDNNILLHHAGSSTYLIKYNSATGQLVWEKGIISMVDGQLAASGTNPMQGTYFLSNYYITEDSSGNIYLLSHNAVSKLNSSGDIVWSKFLFINDAYDNNNINSIRYTCVKEFNGNLYICGSYRTGSSFGYKAVLLKVSSSTGAVAWTRWIEFNSYWQTNAARILDITSTDITWFHGGRDDFGQEQTFILTNSVADGINTSPAYATSRTSSSTVGMSFTSVYMRKLTNGSYIMGGINNQPGSNNRTWFLSRYNSDLSLSAIKRGSTLSQNVDASSFTDAKDRTIFSTYKFNPSTFATEAHLVFGVNNSNLNVDWVYDRIGNYQYLPGPRGAADNSMYGTGPVNPTNYSLWKLKADGSQNSNIDFISSPTEGAVDVTGDAEQYTFSSYNIGFRPSGTLTINVSDTNVRSDNSGVWKWNTPTLSPAFVASTTIY